MTISVPAKPVLVAIIAAMMLAGCAAGAIPPARTPAAATAGDRPAPRSYAGTASVRPPPGSDAVIGRDAADLARMFGAPRLTIALGSDGQKLQFASDRCVLDAYLYAPRSGETPVVTHVDARDAAGEDIDRAGCIAALRRR